MYINNKLKVTPGKWIVAFENIIDGETEVNSNGTEAQHNILCMSDENPDYEYNKKAIVAAINFFKSIDTDLLKKQKEFLFKEIEELTYHNQVPHDDPSVLALEGIISLYDSISDILVDDFGAPEETIFITEETE